MMRTVTISDELFDELKGFVVDPFDDTPDIVLGRLVEIVKKAKNRWSPLDSGEPSEKHAAPSPKKGASSSSHSKLDELPQVADEEVVLL
jgi:hypothetical protein